MNMVRYSIIKISERTFKESPFLYLFFSNTVTEHSGICTLYFFNDFMYLFLERGEGREKEGGRKSNV